MESRILRSEKPMMAGLEAANLIRVFDFYLALMFVIGLLRRYPIYLDAVRIVFAVRGRWPKLMERLKDHHGVLVTGAVLRPLALAFALMAIQLLCSRVIWPDSLLAIGTLMETPWRLAAMIAAAIPMVAVDLYFVISVGAFDRRETEKYLDEAEHWLSSWKAPAIRTLTLGFVNPRRIVDEEVKKGLNQLGEMVSWVAWWVSAQVACRVLCGLMIWLLSAFQ